MQPQVLLLDEPFGALDAKVRKELRRWLRRLHDELHVTSIFVTHDQEEALEVADRVVVINQGQIEQVGTPQEVWDNPASPFVYGFLGDVNLFQGRAHDGSVKFATGLELASTEAQGSTMPRPGRISARTLDVSRPAAGVTRVGRGLLAQLDRAIVVGPVARLELIAQQAPEVAHNHASEKLIEAHISAHEFHTLGLREGETFAGHAPPRQSVCRSGGRNLRQAQRLTKACRVPFFRHSLKDFYAMDFCGTAPQLGLDERRLCGHAGFWPVPAAFRGAGSLPDVHRAAVRSGWCSYHHRTGKPKAAKNMQNMGRSGLAAGFGFWRFYGRPPKLAAVESARVFHLRPRFLRHRRKLFL